MRRAHTILAIHVSVLATILTMLLACSDALGQGGDPNNMSSATAPGAVKQQIDDTTVKRTAAAYVKVRRIEQYGQQALAGAGNDAEKQQIAQQVEAQKLTAVKSEGLEPEQYNQVIQLALADKTFQQRFLSYVRSVDKATQPTD
jgi:hypothetical protein